MKEHLCASGSTHRRETDRLSCEQDGAGMTGEDQKMVQAEGIAGTGSRRSYYLL